MSEAKKIVVIDDNPQITWLLRDILTEEGYAVVTCNEAESGHSLVDRERPDLVILDICMPGINGWELCRYIRRKHRMPILVLSVLTEPPDIQRTLDVGADIHMTKPFSVAELVEQVAELLEQGGRRS